jgi:hypothetical protein
MSIADLKVRLADVQAVNDEGFEAGRIMLRWGVDYSDSIDAAASMPRSRLQSGDATKLPPVSLVSDKPAAIVATATSTGVSSNPASAGASVKANGAPRPHGGRYPPSAASHPGKLTCPSTGNGSWSRWHGR